MAKKKLTFVGVGPDDEPIVDGEFIFWMMDSQGMPLEVLNAILADKGMGFDVIGFIQAGLESGNWKPRTLERKLLMAYEGPDRQIVEDKLSKILY